MKLTLPNILSCLRLATTPLLLWLAWHGYEYVFLVILIGALISDVLDGFIARKFNQTSELGARLDSWADATLYFTLAASAYLLWPLAFLAERAFFELMLCSIIVPAITGLLKFGTLTSYHTWLVKTAAATSAISALILFTGGPGWPFRTAAVITIAAALEQVAITLALQQPLSNVRSLWHVLRAKK